MKRRIGTKLSTAIEKLCRMLLVDAGFYNDHAGGIGGGADSSFSVHRSVFCKARGTRNAARRTIIACIKRNGFDNFTGNSLSHLATPNDNYCSRFTRPNQGKSRRQYIFGFGIGIRHLAIVNKLRFYRTTDEFIMDDYKVYGIEYFV
jgi:hypothetical protein